MSTFNLSLNFLLFDITKKDYIQIFPIYITAEFYVPQGHLRAALQCTKAQAVTVY